MALNLGEASIFARVDLSRLGTDIARAREVALAGFSGIGGALAAAGGVLGGLHLGRMLGGFADAAAMAEEGTARLTTMFNNNRGAAGQTQEQIQALTQELATMARVAIPTAQEAMVQFLTRTEIRGTQFERAVKMLPDVAAFFKNDLVTATNYFTRALEQPGRAMRYLSQKGVPFTQAQINALNMLVKAGPEGITRAQDLTLNVLEAHVSGMAKARAATFAGQREITGAFITGTRLAIGEALVPAFTAINNLMMEVAGHIKEGGMPAIQAFANNFTLAITTIGNFVRQLIAWFQGLPENVQRAFGEMAQLAGLLVPLLGILPRLIMLIGAMTGATRILFGPVGIAAALFASLGGTLEQLIGWLNTAADYVRSFFDAFNGMDPVAKEILTTVAAMAGGVLVGARAYTTAASMLAAAWLILQRGSVALFQSLAFVLFNPVALAFTAIGAAVGYMALQVAKAHQETLRLIAAYDQVIKKAQQASQEQTRREFLQSQTGLGRVKTLLEIAEEVKKAEGGDKGAEDRIFELKKRLKREAETPVGIKSTFAIQADLETINAWRKRFPAGKSLIDEDLLIGENLRGDKIQKILKMPIQDAQDFETFLKLATAELERQQSYYKGLGDVGAGLTADAQKMSSVGALTSKEQNEVYVAQARLGSSLTVAASREGSRVAKQLADLKRLRAEMGELTDEKKKPPERQEQLLEKVRITGIVEFAKYIQTSLERSFDAEREARNADNLKKTADGIDDMKKDTKRIADKLERGADDLGLRAEE